MSYSRYDIPISLIRQHIFCPRIPYFILLEFGRPQEPLWVRQGRELHEVSEKLFFRRSLVKFGLEMATKSFHVRVKSQKYGCFGEIDMILQTKDFVYPVEFKTQGSRPAQGHILQLVAYGMCLEEQLKKSFETGFLVYRENNKMYRIEVNREHRKKVIDVLETIRKNIEKGVHPPTSATPNKCIQCEWINFCNDRL